MTRVAFEFGDRVLEGTIVDDDPVGDVRGVDTMLTVEVDGSSYRELESNVTKLAP